MYRMIFVLAVSLGSVSAGYLTVRIPASPFRYLGPRAGSISKNLKLLAIFILNPIPIANSFWTMPLDTGGLITLPLLGLTAMLVNGLSAAVLTRLFHIPAKRAASVFVAGMFTNILSFGGLTVYMFYGMPAYALLHLYNMTIPFCYYAIGYPVSRHMSLADSADRTSTETGFFRRARGMANIRILREQPYLFIPIGAMFIGILLNVTGIGHWRVLDTVSGVFIPLLSGMLGFAIGITLRFSRVSAYIKEISLVALVKFVISPAIMIPIGVLAGLPGILGGVPFYVLVIASVMPVAFNALVPPALYGFDLDLANSAWIVTTAALLVVVPLLYIVLPT